MIAAFVLWLASLACGQGPMGDLTHSSASGEQGSVSGEQGS